MVAVPGEKRFDSNCITPGKWTLLFPSYKRAYSFMLCSFTLFIPGTSQNFHGTILGTQFMTKLHEKLGDWIQHKVDTDQAWQGIRVYLSGHNVSKSTVAVDCFCGY